MSRTSSFTDEIGVAICEAIVESDYGLEQVCEADEFPSARTVFRWLADPDPRFDLFRQRYARAKEEQGHVQGFRAVRDALDAKDAQLGRLKYDARKWAASKLASKVWGDSTHVKLSDPDGGPVRTETRLDISTLSEEQLRALASIRVDAES